MSPWLRVAALGLGLCLAACQSTSRPVGPNPDVEVVAVSPDIASKAHPVFYYRDAQDSSRLLAYDWTGTLRGTLQVTASEPFGAFPSEDGTLVLLMHAHVTKGGRGVGRVASGSWAGDDGHVCAFAYQSGGPSAPPHGSPVSATLFYQSASGESRRVLDYGQYGSHGGPTVLACSAANDRAVIGQSFVADMSGLEVIRLSDGHVIGGGPPQPAMGPRGVVVSADGALIGMGSTASAWNPSGENAFTVLRLPSKSTMTRITGGGLVRFSADDSRALIVDYLGGSNERGRYQLIDLGTGRSLWSAVLSPGTVLTRPGTGDFLVASRTYEPSLTRTNSNDAFEDVWLVSANGSARLLLRHAAPLE